MTIESTRDLVRVLDNPQFSEKDEVLVANALKRGIEPHDPSLSEQPLHAHLKHVSTLSTGEGTLQSLLRHGADPNARDAEGRTGFHYLADKQDPRGAMRFVQALQDAGGDMTLRDYQGRACWEHGVKGPAADHVALAFERKARVQSQEQAFNAFDATFPAGAPIEKQHISPPDVLNKIPASEMFGLTGVGMTSNLPTPAQVNESVSKPSMSVNPHRPKRIEM